MRSVRSGRLIKRAEGRERERSGRKGDRRGKIELSNRNLRFCREYLSQTYYVSGDVFTRRATSRNHVANNRARRKRFFPRRRRRNAAHRNQARKPARNSMKTVFLGGDILSRGYLLVSKNTSALARSALAREEDSLYLCPKERRREMAGKE